MLDPIFDLLAGLLAWFYSLIPSYGFTIIALTTLVLVVLSPLTYRSTKSMVAMRRLQPEVKRLQKKHKGDRETLNQEMMALYQKHQVSPLSGCLPILIQSPVFIVMFRVIRGITRRSSTIGFDIGQGAVASLNGNEAFDPAESYQSFREATGTFRNFHPEYLDEGSEIYQDLIQDNEMLWLGLDLSRTPLETLGDSVGTALPYLVMVILVAFLSWYQQRQIQGRMTGEISSQQQMIMRILPWMLPVFSFTMPGGLVLYFIVSALLRILQQAYITRTVYQNEELMAPLELEHDDDGADDDDDEPENPFAAMFGGGAKKADTGTVNRHGSRRPTSGASGRNERSRPSRSTPERKPSSSSKKKTDTAPVEKPTGWGRAKRSAPAKNEQPEKPVSRRVTPKGDSTSRRGKK